MTPMTCGTTWLRIGVFVAGLGGAPSLAQTPVQLAPSLFPRIAVVDERFQSYNVEMLEVTGGKFWKPYSSQLRGLQQGASDTPAGMNPELYEYRPPIDLGNRRLRKLAAALGPAYIRVSGTWANSTYFAETDEAAASPPAGFNGVLTHQQWKGVIDFARAVDARIVTSFATSAGARDSTGVWNSGQARRFLAYTGMAGGSIAAAEFMNEPNLAAMGGSPKGYDAAAYGRDFKIFRAFAKQAAPEMLVVGPGSVGDTNADDTSANDSAGFLNTRAMLAASGPGVDRFSYHHYGALSKRCIGLDNQTSPDAALTEEWLARTDHTLASYRKLRDQYEGGKPIWVTETADAACGGNPWAATFLDTFRYLDQLGRLAKQQVQVVAHNTLAASDYGLLDENSFAPRPNYWGALLWRKLMGSTVLDAGVPIQPGLHLYAHCLRDAPGGGAVLAINTDKSSPHTIHFPVASERYTLASSEMQSASVTLNGAELKLLGDDELPPLNGVRLPAGVIDLAPASISFFATPDADNSACR
jgi:hypothetical protein